MEMEQQQSSSSPSSSSPPRRQKQSSRRQPQSSQPQKQSSQPQQRQQQQEQPYAWSRVVQSNDTNSMQQQQRNNDSNDSGGGGGIVGQPKPPRQQQDQMNQHQQQQHERQSHHHHQMQSRNIGDYNNNGHHHYMNQQNMRYNQPQPQPQQSVTNQHQQQNQPYSWPQYPPSQQQQPPPPPKAMPGPNNSMPMSPQSSNQSNPTNDPKFDYSNNNAASYLPRHEQQPPARQQHYCNMPPQSSQQNPQHQRQQGGMGQQQQQHQRGMYSSQQGTTPTPQQNTQNPPQSRHSQNPSQQSSQPQQPSQPSPSQPTPQQQQQPPSPLDTRRYSYEWDSNNVQLFLGARSQMLNALFAPRPKSNARETGNGGRGNNTVPPMPNSNVNFARSQSDELPMSPTRPADGNKGGRKQYGRAKSVGGKHQNNNQPSSRRNVPPPPPPPTMPHLNTPNKHHQSRGGPQSQPTNHLPTSPIRTSHARTATILHEYLPNKGDYFSAALRLLLLDTPLELVGSAPSFNSANGGGLDGGSLGGMQQRESMGSVKTSRTQHGVGQSGREEPPQKEVRIQPRPPHPNGETLYLLPRYYLTKWLHWAANTVMVMSIEAFFVRWDRADNADNDKARAKGRKKMEKVDENEPGEQNEPEKRMYTLSPTALKALSALSLLSDQYQLHIDTQADFVGWLEELGTCWNAWNTEVREFHAKGGFEAIGMHTNNGRQGQGTNNGDEKKHDDGSQYTPISDPVRVYINPHKHGKQHSSENSGRASQEQPSEPQHPPPYPQFAFPQSRLPGPVDCRILSTRKSPLLMHQHVALSMKGVLPSACCTTAADDANSVVNDHGPIESLENLSSFIDSLQTPNDPHAINSQVPKKLAVVPVPTGFYQLLRSTIGIKCDDGDPSFAPNASDLSLNSSSYNGSGVENPHPAPPPRAAAAWNSNGLNGGSMENGGNATSGAKSNRGGRSSATGSSAPSGNLQPVCTLLFHDQWDNSTGPNRHAHFNKSDENDSNGGRVPSHHEMYQGYHPYYFASDQPNGNGSSSKGNSSGYQQPEFRPIEFRRRILEIPLKRATEMDEEGGELSWSDAAKKNTGPKSPYSKLMHEAIKSKKSSDERDKKANGKNAVAGGKVGTAGLTVDTSMGTNGATTKESVSGNVGYTVEVFPIEFHYAVVDDDDNDRKDDASPADGTQSAATNGNNKADSISPKHSRQGIALASRVSPAYNVLRDLQRAAAPHRATACVRLWRKKQSIDNATAGGDGYELFDVSALLSSSSNNLPGSPSSSNGTSPKSTSSKSKQEQQEEAEPLTIGKWLGLEPLYASQGINNSNGQQKVELLIEVRHSLSSKWVREPLELENRLQVGDFVDAQDSAKKWYEGIVREVTPDTIKVHYFGWGSKWDTVLPKKQVAGSKVRVQPLWTKVTKWREQIKVGDEVEIRESTSLVQRPKWHRATVLAVGSENDSPRELVCGAELEMLDLDGRGKKKRALMLLGRKRQILVEVPQEMHNIPTATPLTPPRRTNNNGDDILLPAAQPPFRRWVNLYGEEICKVNTHKTATKKTSNSPATLNYTLESKRAPVEVMKPFNNIHGSGFVRESLRGIPPAAGTVGLHNLGNSCYMNSILQCVNHMKPITQYFLKGEYLKEVNKKNPLGSGGRMVTAYAHFLNEIYSGEYSILAPRIIKQTVSLFAPQFNNTYQHDSQEFCQYLMDGLHEDLNRVTDKPYVEQMEAMGMDDDKAALESWKKHLLRHDSIFVDYTQGMHRSHLTCPSCGRESIKFDVYSSISLPLVPAKNRPSIPLKDCLDQFAAGEQLDEHNAWYCSSCKKHVCALKLITLWNTPDILVLHLKRFTFEKCPTVDGRILRRKIEEKVDFPIDRLDLSSYVLGPKDPDAPPVYKLFGVSEHTGVTANSGHYTATVRNSEDGNWYRYNDSNVGSTSGDAAVTGGAYLLFYQRVKGSLRWAGMEKQMINENGDSDGFREVTAKKKKKK